MANTFLSRHGWKILLLVYLAITLYPILPSGYYSDDAFLAQGTKGQMLWEDINLWQLAGNDTKEWIRSGRFAPLAYFTQRATFTYCNDPATYKALIFALNVLAVTSFGWFIWLFTQHPKFTALVLLVLPAFFQFRVFHHDAFTTFNGMYPIIAISNFGALGLFIQYLRKHNKWSLWGSTLLFAVGFLYLEFTLCFTPLYLLLALTVPDKRPHLGTLAKYLWPIAMVVAIYLGSTLYLRSQVASVDKQYSGLQTNFAPNRMLKVVHNQVFSTIPLIYLNYEKNFMGGKPEQMLAEMRKYGSPLALLLIVVLFIGIWLRYTRIGGEASYKQYPMLWMGLMLLLLPALILMVSEKYQANPWPGNGYLPVYLQNFGAAILWAMLIYLLGKVTARGIAYAQHFLLVVFLLVAGITFMANMRAIRLQNHQFSNPGKALEKALDDGLLKEIDPNDVIWLGNNYHWGATRHYQYLFLEKSGKRLRVVNQIHPQDSLWLENRVFHISFPPSEPNEVTVKQLTGFNGDSVVYKGLNKKYTYFD